MNYSPKYMVVLASIFICLSLFFNLSHAQKLPDAGSGTLCNYNSAVTNAKNNWWTVDRLKTETPSPVRSLTQSTDGAHPTKWIVTAFQAFVDDNWEIFRSDGSDSAGSNISNNAFNDVRPRISPDGKQIVFVSDRDGNDEVYKMNTDGLGLQRLTDNATLDTMPVWSPDGQKILFVSKRDGNAALYTMAVDGSNITRLTNNEVDNAFPTWSPDGKFIAWVQINGEDRKLWIMNADGSNPHAITGALKSLQNLVWIPSRNEIAFDFDPDGFRVENHLAQIAVDGSNFRLLNESFNGDELWLSGWSEFDQYFLVTKVYYNCFTPNGELVTQQQAGIIYPGEGAGFNPRYFTYYSAMLHREKLDKLPPVTKLDPLPAFSRSSGLAIGWSGFDIGPSGIAGVSVLMKSKNYPPWATEPQWVPYDPSVIPYLEDIIYLKSFGVDDAGNAEPIRVEADTQTQIFDWLVAGQIMDNRGHPVPNWDVPIFPPPLNEAKSDATGAYIAYRRGGTEFTFSEMTNIDSGGDTSFSHYQLPADNVILNGDFENDVAADWAVNNQSIVAQTNLIKHNGNSAVRLGTTCVVPCLSDVSLKSLSTDVNLQIGASQMLFDSSENFHLIGRNQHNVPLYLSRSKQGVWGEPVEFIGDTVAGSLSASMDPTNVIHVIYTYRPETAPYRDQVLYVNRTIDNKWSEPTSVTAGYGGNSVVDSAGNLHVVYACGDVDCPNNGTYGLYYIVRSSNGVWSTPQLAHKPGNSEWVTPNYSIIVDQLGNANLFYIDYLASGSSESALFHTVFDSNGKIIKNQTLPFVPAQSIPALAKNSAGDILVLLPNQLYKMSATGVWSRFPILVSKTASDFLLVDSRQNFHLFNSRSWTDQILAPNGSWSAPTFVGGGSTPPSHIAFGAVALDKSDNPLFIQSTLEDVSLKSIARVTIPVEATIRQAITIPPTLHRPTLSFMYRLDSFAQQNTLFEVSVSEGLSHTQVFSSSALAPWQLGWADMTPWSGHSVTVTFSLHQAISDTVTALYLDDISLGSWRTSVLQSVSPAHVEANQSATLVISGENFIPTPKVTIGTTLLTDVRWIDENHLEATIPSTLAPGFHDLTVTNEGGISAVKLSAIGIGKQVYLPVIAR